jgi:hypothetical protein
MDLDGWIRNLPFIALAVAGLGYALLAHPPASYQPQPSYVRARHSLFALFFAVLLTTIFGGFTIRALASLQAFRRDPVCAAGIGARPSDSSALCSVRPAVVLGHDYYTYPWRRRRRYWVDLDLGSTGRQYVLLYHFSNVFWSGLNRGDREAKVALFRGDVVEIATASDSTKTTKHPEAVFETDAVLTAAFAGASVLGALIYAFRASS